MKDEVKKTAAPGEQADWKEKYFNERFFWMEQARAAKESEKEVFQSFAALQNVIMLLLGSLAKNYGENGCIFLPDPDPDIKAVFRRVEGGYMIEINAGGE